MIDLRQVSCCLITKDADYPPEILAHLTHFPFGERIVFTNCGSPHAKHAAFAKARFDWIYYQDDDAICPVALLAARAQPGIITCAMKPFHLEKYAQSRIALLGWGALFEKSKLAVLQKYRDLYPVDELYKRETERIFTYLDYPQQRLDLPIEDLPSAFAPDRLSNQQGHYDYIAEIEARCAPLVGGAA